MRGEVVDTLSKTVAESSNVIGELRDNLAVLEATGQYQSMCNALCKKCEPRAVDMLGAIDRYRSCMQRSLTMVERLERQARTYRSRMLSSKGDEAASVLSEWEEFSDAWSSEAEDMLSTFPDGEYDLVASAVGRGRRKKRAARKAVKAGKAAKAGKAGKAAAAGKAVLTLPFLKKAIAAWAISKLLDGVWNVITSCSGQSEETDCSEEAKEAKETEEGHKQEGEEKQKHKRQPWEKDRKWPKMKPL